MSTAPADPETLGIVTDVGAVANAIAAIFKAGDDLFNVLNSPAALALRQQQDIQDALAAMDGTLKQAQAGDADAEAKLQSEVSG